MANDTVITVIGNLTSDPELRYTQTGLAVANFTIASTPRTFDRAKNEWVDGEALFLRASVWREFAEHVAGSLTKGTRIIAQGRLRQRSYETKEGEKRTSIELEIDAIGPDLLYATASVIRVQKGATGTQQRNQQAQQGGGAGDVWAGQQQSQQAIGQPPWQQQQGQDPVYQQAAQPQQYQQQPVQQAPQYQQQGQAQSSEQVWGAAPVRYDGETPF